MSAGLPHSGKFPCRLLFLSILAFAELNAAEKSPITLNNISVQTQDNTTRVTVELSGKFTFDTDKIGNPDRLFFDFSATKPKADTKSVITVRNGHLKQIRVGESKPKVTRVVLDLERETAFTTSVLQNPHRLIIDIRRAGMVETATMRASTILDPELSSPAPALAVKSKRMIRPLVPPPAFYERRVPQKRFVAVINPPAFSSSIVIPEFDWHKQHLIPATAKLPGYRPATKTVAKTLAQTLAMPKAPEIRDPTPRAQSATSAAPRVAIAAKLSTTGPDSLTRALGLKIGRIVIDPGHGGHDQGSSGPTGLLEKELVLDISTRLGAMIEEQLGSEVVFTRSDDRFIPLEERPRIANQVKADLFLSIHANSSVYRAATGVETYYLSFTTSKQALEVAARENASSQHRVSELKDLLQKIALKDKVDESREFASRLLTPLSKATSSTSAASNRGVKKAPFIVLIGANMPSVLAEIGFVSNPRDEQLMKKPEQRQKIAEALMRGLMQYAESLSHFQLARRAADDE